MGNSSSKSENASIDVHDERQDADKQRQSTYKSKNDVSDDEYLNTNRMPLIQLAQIADVWGTIQSIIII